MLQSILSVLVGSDLARDISGDLEEERRRRAAPLWFLRASIGVLFYTLVDRIRVWAREVLARGLGFGRLPSDLRHAVRSLRRTPWYAITAFGVIALGMALATTVFAIVDGVLFKPLPFPNPGELRDVGGSFSRLADDGFRTQTSFAELRAWRQAAPEIGFTAMTYGQGVVISESETTWSAEIDDQFFDVLGVRPILGGFQPGDFGPRPLLRPALISYAMWQERFGGDPGVIGRVLSDSTTGRGLRVAGVLPRGFVFPQPAGRLAPSALTPMPPPAGPNAFNPRARSVYVVARVPESALASVQTRLSATVPAITAAYPRLPDDPSASPTRQITRGPVDTIRIRPLRAILTAATRVVSAVILSTAGALILLACLNLACLAGGRLLDRRRELALRRALGATAGALVRLLAMEHTVMILLGTAIGLAASRGLVTVAMRLISPDLALLKTPDIDWRVISFALGAAVLSVGIVTIWSAATALRSVPRSVLAAASGGAGRSWTRGRALLIGGQVALALVMALGGSLLAASLARVWAEDPGFHVDQTMLIRVSPRSTVALDDMRGLVEDIRRMPGVTGAAGLAHPFLERIIGGSSFNPPPGTTRTTDVEVMSVTSGFFEATGLRAIDGRVPGVREFDLGSLAIVVSQRVASLYWPGRSAVGQTLSDGKQTFNVIGVVPDARYGSLDRDSGGEIYSAITNDHVMLNFLLTFDGRANGALDPIVKTIGTRLPGLRVVRAETMAAALGASIQTRRFQTMLFATFGGAALLIVGVGILGAIAMAVSRRTREVGIRMALGARSSRVVTMVLGEQLVPVVAGLVAGGLVAAWSVGFLKSYLYKMTVYDWRAWSLAVVVLLAVSAVAAFVPALRASRVDPAKALRDD